LSQDELDAVTSSSSNILFCRFPSQVKIEALNLSSTAIKRSYQP
jgi:hypothetical protein